MFMYRFCSRIIVNAILIYFVSVCVCADPRATYIQNHPKIFNDSYNNGQLKPLVSKAKGGRETASCKSIDVFKPIPKLKPKPNHFTFNVKSCKTEWYICTS